MHAMGNGIHVDLHLIRFGVDDKGHLAVVVRLPNDLRLGIDIKDNRRIVGHGGLLDS